MHQTTCLHFTNHLSHYSTKGHPNTLYGASTPPFKYQSSHNILPFCHHTSSTSLLQYTLIIFSTIWYVIFSFFPCILLTPSHIAPSPLTTTLLSPPLAIYPLPYTAPCTSNRTLSFRANILYSPTSDHFWLPNKITYSSPLPDSHTRLSVPQPIPSTTWPSSSAPTPSSFQPFCQFRLCQRPNE